MVDKVTKSDYTDNHKARHAVTNDKFSNLFVLRSI